MYLEVITFSNKIVPSYVSSPLMWWFSSASFGDVGMLAEPCTVFHWYASVSIWSEATLDRDQGIQCAFKESRDQGPAVVSDLILLLFSHFILTSDITLGVSLWALGHLWRQLFDLICPLPLPYISAMHRDFLRELGVLFFIHIYQGIQQMALNILWLYAWLLKFY